MPAKKKAKAGASKDEAAHKRKLFVEAFLSNGGNATQAAIAAGYSGKTAKMAGSRLMTHDDVRAALKERRASVIEKAELTTERVLREVACIAFSDPRRYYRPDGALKEIAELDDEAAAALAGVDVIEGRIAIIDVNDPKGEKRATKGDEEPPERNVQTVPLYIKKLRMWDKNTALGNAMKHLGLFEKDNEQAGAAAAKFIYVPQKGARARP